MGQQSTARQDYNTSRAQVESERIGAAEHAALQLAGLYLLGLAAVPGTFAAFWLLARTAAALGAPAALWAHAAGAPVFALVALASPVFAPMLPLLLPVRPTWLTQPAHALECV